MAIPSIDDDLDGSSIDGGLGVEYVASLVFFFLVMLKSQDLGDNENGTLNLHHKRLVLLHRSVAGAWRLA